ncbi:ABC-type sugar transport system permease subunit [Paenibacillus castaneae]|uniref:carbohydrate ABC transporter permease n=1 Tax=Paenibacillus castaneae TaxID=474957 RepID=UPI001ABAEFB1|nr:sugar ABC transporter permease [Paenibacillus castaneae]NIK77128.1 ABC-type sugar transport system permease subunit [Paenibacillus castaneae]
MKMKMKKTKREAMIGYMLISPWVIGFLVFMAYPLFFSLYMSFNKVMITPYGIETHFLGWGNYKDAFLVDVDFTQKLFLFLKSNILMIPIVIVFSLFVALLINQPIRGRNLFRAIFFLPVVITSGEVVQELFSQGAATIPIVEKYGIITMIQDNLSPGMAGPIIGIINQFILILWYSGVQILIFLAGLQKVNTQVYEAAAMDGASPWVTFWKITLPEVKPFILVNLIYTIIDLFTNGFSDVIKLIQDNMFKANTGFGYASALAWIYFTVIFAVLLIFVLFFRNKDQSIRAARRS